MKPEHKRYILENIDKKPIKKIAQELNLKERRIRKFLEKEGKEKEEQIDLRKETKTPVKKQTIFISIILIIILGFTVYGNSLNGKFIRDDITLVRDNIYIKSWSKALKFFARNIARGGRQDWNSYRPIQMVTYMIDYSMWKLDVRGYHLTNTLLHILVALAIYWFINILYDDWLLSSFTSILYVIHPIHTGAINYISGRADSLSAIFMLCSFILYIKLLGKKNIILYILMLLTYILALLSRENSLILPVLLLFYHYTYKKRLNVKNFFPILILTFIYILLRITILRTLLSNITHATTVLQRAPGFFVAITNYTKLLLLPFDLHANYGIKLFNLSNPQAILGALILVSLLIYAFKKRCTNSLILFSIGWFFITLLPQSNLYPINAYMAEHWLYLPSIGFFLILAKGISSICKTKEFKTLALVIIIVLASFYSYLTIKQNDYWKEPIAFYKKTLEYIPDDYNEYINLGNVYRDLGRHEDAITCYKKAIKIDPTDEVGHNNLGAIYYKIGETEKAIASYKKAIEIKPSYEEAYNNLGYIYYTIGKKEEAIASYKKSIEINPEYASPHYNLGELYVNIGKNEEAIVSYKKAIEIDPTYAKAYNNLGIVYSNIGQKEEAITLYKRAIAINPNLAEAYNNLGGIYRDIGQKEKAITLYKKAIAINPNLTEAYYNLGNIYYGIGRKEEAITLYKKAIAANPNYAAVHFNLSAIYFNRRQYALAVKHCDLAIKFGYKVDLEFLRLLQPYRK